LPRLVLNRTDAVDLFLALQPQAELSLEPPAVHRPPVTARPAGARLFSASPLPVASRRRPRRAAVATSRRPEQARDLHAQRTNEMSGQPVARALGHLSRSTSGSRRHGRGTSPVAARGGVGARCATSAPRPRELTHIPRHECPRKPRGSIGCSVPSGAKGGGRRRRRVTLGSISHNLHPAGIPAAAWNRALSGSPRRASIAARVARRHRSRSPEPNRLPGGPSRGPPLKAALPSPVPVSIFWNCVRILGPLAPGAEGRPDEPCAATVIATLEAVSSATCGDRDRFRPQSPADVMTPGRRRTSRNGNVRVPSLDVGDGSRALAATLDVHPGGSSHSSCQQPAASGQALSSGARGTRIGNNRWLAPTDL